MKPLMVVLFFWLAVQLQVVGQTTGRQVEVKEEAWLQYYNTLKFSPRFSLKTDAGLREELTFDKLKQLLIRAGVYYQLHPQATVGLGAAYFLSDQQGSMRPEWRPYQEVLLEGSRLGRLEVSHRFRLEERFFRNVTREGLPSGTNFNYRARYRVQLQIPLNQKEMTGKTWFVSLFDEVMLNFGDEVVYNVLNNNRLGAGLGYLATEKLRVVPTYVFQIGQGARGNAYTHTHILWLTVYHTLDLTN